MTDPAAGTSLANTMDPARAHFYGTFVAAAYGMFAAGDLTPAISAGFPAGYRLALYLAGVDHTCGRTEPEFFGFVAQATADPQELVIAVRGTDTLLEWVVDAEFRPVPFAGVAGGGHVEDGFCSVYTSLAARTPDGAPADLHAFVRGAAPSAPITLVGHSLGSAVVTLLALDLAANADVRGLTLYTLASPRTGDAAFAACVDAHVPASWRVVNAPDIVPKLPPLYAHVATAYEIDSLLAPGAQHSLVSYHRLATYLAVLNGGAA